ncbi:MAG: hypothetical protein GY906_14285 [bacterium]|nr:hypothetical protein [bacterium]
MRNRADNDLVREFVDFVETSPVLPGQALDDTIRERIGADLSQQRWRVLGKVTLIQVAAGLTTLCVCPQFGLGFGHLPLLHDVHSTLPLPLFHLICGLLFVSLGGVSSGLVLSRNDLVLVERRHYRYFLVYGCLVYLALVNLSPEAFVAGSLAWIPGAVLGNLVSFSLGRRLRRRLA